MSDFPLYEHWSYDRIYRTDMLKQPDVLMAMYLYPADFTAEEIAANYSFYEPRCIHESSLSPSVHRYWRAGLAAGRTRCASSALRRGWIWTTITATPRGLAPFQHRGGVGDACGVLRGHAVRGARCGWPRGCRGLDALFLSADGAGLDTAHQRGGANVTLTARGALLLTLSDKR